MAPGMMTPGPYESGEGLATGGHAGPEPQPEAPVIGGGRTSRRTPPQDWSSHVWQLHTLSLAGGVVSLVTARRG